MNDEPLDSRIRSMLATALADTPAAPQLPPARVAPTRFAAGGRRGLVLAAMAAAALVVAGVLVWGSPDDDRRMVVGSTSSGSTAPEPAPLWPDDIAVVVASDRGVERVFSENGEIAVQRAVDGQPVERAFELADGSFVYQIAGGDIKRASAGSVEALVAGDGLHLQDAEIVDGRLVYAYAAPSDSPEASFRLVVQFDGEPISVLPPGAWAVGYDRFMFSGPGAVLAGWGDDMGFRSATAYDSTGATVPLTDPFNFSGALRVVASGDGRSGRLDATGALKISARLAVPVVVDVPNPTEVVDLDLAGQAVVVNYRSAPGVLIDLRDGQSYPLPVVDGTATVSMLAPDAPPPDTTVATSTSVPEPVSDVVTDVITAGPDGVWAVHDGGEPTLLTPERMAFAVAAPDGSVIMQRRVGSGIGQGWTEADTMPLLWRQGEPLADLFDTLFPYANLAPGWFRVHDVAMVAGHPTMLYELASSQSSPEDPPGSLRALRLDTGEIVVVSDAFGGWEAGSTRMHLAETGLIVGESSAEASHGFSAFSLLGDATAVPTATDLGHESSYYDCNDCPQLYTVSRDGSTIAWLDGADLVQWDVGKQVERSRTSLRLGEPDEPVRGATNLELGDGFVVIERNYTADSTRPPLVIEYGNGTNVAYELPGVVPSISGTLSSR